MTDQVKSQLVDLSDDEFVTSDKFVAQERFKPLEPSVWKVIKIQKEITPFTNDKGEKQQNIVFTLEPLQIAWKTLDGLRRVRIKLSNRDNSVYAIMFRAMEYSMSESLGSQFKWEKQSDVIGSVLTWGEVDPTVDERFKGFGKLVAKMGNVMLPMGAAPDDWKDNVPADLDSLKRAAMVEAAEKAAARAAASGSVPSTTVETAASQAIFEVDVMETVAAWLDGKPSAGVFTAVRNDPDFGAYLDANGLKADFHSGKIRNALLANGSLVVESGTYKKV